GSLAGSLTVGFVLGGSASNGVDYRAIAVPSSVVIPAGLMSGTLAVVPLQDAQFEGAETVVLTLSPSLDYTVGASASATVTIEDDDYPQPTISSPLSASTFAGVPFQYQIVAANTPVVPGATITYGATGLPAGLVVDPVSGLISGTVVSAWDGVVTLRATNPYRTATASLALLVKAPPSIRTQPLGGTWRESDPLVLSVAAEGSGPLAYRWKRGDQWITGGTQSTLRVNAPLSAAVAGSYRVEVSNAYGTATSAVVEVGVILAARVVTPPSGVRVDVGQAFSLQAVVSGTPPFTYQWMKNGANLSNQTQATLSVGAARPADAGRYQVLVMNAAGGMLSSGADVLVNVPPTILSSPANTSVNLGSALRLSVVADGTPPMSYQWRKGGQPIAGGTQATLLVGSVQEGGGGSYDVVVTNVAGSATSAASVVSVNLPPRVVVHPENQGVNPGGELVLSVVAEGTGVLRYRWWRDGVGILGAESDTLRLSGVDEGYVGNYWVQVSNAVGTVDSRAATVTLNRPVRILSQPAGMQREVGQSARLEVAADGTGPLQYRWLRNGTVLGGTGAALNFESLGKADEGVYQVEVSNVVGALRSAEVFLKVNDYARILSQPLGVVGKVGRAAVLSVGAVGSGTLSYQWYRNGAELAEGRGATLRLEGLEKGQEGDYDVVVSSGEASQRSAAARVQVIGIGEVQGNYGGSLERNAAGVAAGAGRYPGRLSVALTGRGLFSGMLQWEGGRYVVRGQMDGEMGTVSEIGRGTRGALRVRMQVNWVNGGPELSVEVEEDGLGAGMEARGRMRMVRVDPVNLPVTGATHYTVLLTPGAGGGLPEAPGYATLDVGRTGVTVLSGRLGDGTMVTDSGVFGADRRVAVQMPVRAAAFPFSGYVGGVLEVSGLGVGANVGGVLDWRRPGGGTGALAAVYAGSLAASGGVYRSPALSGGTDAWVGRSGSAQWRSVAGGGNVAAAMTLFGNYGLVLSGTGSEQVRLLRVDRVSGVVRGIYLEAGGRGVKRMEGVFLQGEGRMGGFILDPLGASGSWSAQFAPAP
ncbi:MAG: hypothetical protein RLZZ244_516, partial [Verrucomicrobiota bacterium]